MADIVVRLKTKTLFSAFRVNLRDFYKNRIYAQHHLHIQPSEIDKLSFYEYQWMLKDLVEMIKEQNGGKKGAQDQEDQMSDAKAQANSYTKGFGKMPNMGNMKMPKL